MFMDSELPYVIFQNAPIKLFVCSFLSVLLHFSRGRIYAGHPVHRIYILKKKDETLCGHGGQTDTLSHSAIFSTGEPAELAPLDNLVGERLV